MIKENFHMTDTLSVISNVFWTVLMIVAGIVLLVTPYDTFQNVLSKTTVKICGVIVLLCGIAHGILFLTGFFF